MPNFTLKSREDLDKLQNIASNINSSIFRTGGTVSNFAVSSSNNGYGFKLKDLLLNGGLELLSIYNQQSNFTKNYLHIIGNTIKNKNVIYVVNIFEPLLNTLIGIEILKSYGCNIIALELGNEQYFKTRGLSVQKYLEKCKNFEVLKGQYTLLYQLTTTKSYSQWNAFVIQPNKQYSYHNYSKDFIEFKNSISIINKNVALDTVWLTEWNNKNAFSDTTNYYNYISDVLDFCTVNKIKNSFHNFVGDTWGMIDDNFIPRQKLLDIFINDKIN